MKNPILQLIIISLFLISCNSNTNIKDDKESAYDKVLESEVIAFQRAYGVGIIGISNAYHNQADFEQMGTDFVEKFYAFSSDKVLVKIPDNQDKSVRSTFEGMLSYLIANDTSFDADKGFALERWKNVEWNNIGIINDHHIAIAVGRAVFTRDDDSKLYRDYTMFLKKTSDKKLKLITHKLSQPCD